MFYERMKVEVKNFLIQTKQVGEFVLPAAAFGQTAVDVVEYYDWFSQEKRYTATPITEERSFAPNELSADCIPIGSVEFALGWFKAMGVDNVKPLNIPPELWHLCDRRVTTGFLCDFNGKYMVKDINTIKSAENGLVELCCDERNDKEYFISEWLDDVESEWRVFVFNGEIQDIRCYSGDPWTLPEKKYVENIAKVYSDVSGKHAFTIDVMVTEDGKTDLVELHDFFSCGLYGFEDFSVLPLMWSAAITDILKADYAQKGCS